MKAGRVFLCPFLACLPCADGLFSCLRGGGYANGIYCAFIESGVLQGDVTTYKTNFGVTLTSKGNRRTLTSFMGYKRSDLNGNAVYYVQSYVICCG